MHLQNLFTHRLIRALRVVLPFVVMVLFAIPVWNYLSRRDQGVAPRAEPQNLPKDLAVLTEDFTFSRTEEGRTIFTIRAKTNLGFTDNKNMLEGVEVTVHGEAGGAPVRSVRSKRCSYDQQTGDIRFIEDVEAQLDERTHVRTAELRYNHVERLIESSHQTFIEQSGSMTGQANSIEYSLQTGILNLKGDVKINTLTNASLEAGLAIFNQKENWASTAGGVHLRSGTAWVRGTMARASLEPETFKPKVVFLEGGVTGESEEWTIRAAWLEATMSAAGVAERIRTGGAAQLERPAGEDTQVLTGEEIEATLSDAGDVALIEARRNARMVFGPGRELSSTEIRVNAAGSINTAGTSVMQLGESRIEGRRFTIEQGEIVKFSTPDRAILKAGARRTSADRTEAQFDNRTNQLVELIQTGHFDFQEGQRQGRAENARFVEGGAVVILEGSSVMSDSAAQMRVEAHRIRLSQKDNSFSAARNVKTVTKRGQDPVLVFAENAQGNAEAITYTGDVQVWSGNAHVRAAKAEASIRDSGFRAEGNVQSVFESIRASSDLLVYDDRQQTAHYTGRVRAQKQDMNIESGDLKIKLQGNGVSEIAAGGGVVLTGRDRRGTGLNATYDVARDEMVLTGKPAEVSDKTRGVTRGARLTMNTKGDKITVEGGADSPAVSKHAVKK